jgi:heme exporter protein CcmD
MFEFGKYAEYMALGYAVTLLILGGMVLWLILRYQALRREQTHIDHLEAEIRDEVAATVGAVEEQAQPEAAAPGVSGMTNPSSERARSLPET